MRIVAALGIFGSSVIVRLRSVESATMQGFTKSLILVSSRADSRLLIILEQPSIYPVRLIHRPHRATPLNRQSAVGVVLQPVVVLGQHRRPIVDSGGPDQLLSEVKKGDETIITAHFVYRQRLWACSGD